MHNIRSITLSSLSDAEMEQLRAGGNAVRADIFHATFNLQFLRSIDNVLDSFRLQLTNLLFLSTKVAEKVWFAKWSEDEEPRPSPNDEAALRKFIRMAYVDKRWQAGSSGSFQLPSGYSTSTASNDDSNLNFDFSSSYAAQPSHPVSDMSHNFNEIPLQPITSEPAPVYSSNFAPIDIPLSASPMDARSPSYGASGANPLDLISWDEKPSAASHPQQVAEEEPRRPVYHVQQSSSPPTYTPGTSMDARPSPQYHVSQSQDARHDSRDPEISRLEELIATQQRQFQQQMEQQQREQQKLQQQLQQARIQQQISDHHVMMSKQFGVSSPSSSPATHAPTGIHPAASTAAAPTAGQPKMYMPMMSGSPTNVSGGYPGSYMAAGVRPAASNMSPVPSSTSTGQPIMVLGPNGQLIPLSQAQQSYSPQLATSQVPPPAKATTATSVNGARPPGVAFTPLVSATGQALVAPSSSPLMTLGGTQSTPSNLPPGSIGPHYVPAPGGGYQAVYMVPSGTLPPGAAKTNSSATATIVNTQRPQHAPMLYGQPGSVPAPRYPSVASTNHQFASKQEEDDFALALRLQREEDAGGLDRNTGIPHSAPRPAPQPQRAPVNDKSDSLIANASYIANDEELARQLAAADLSDGE